MNNSLTVRRTKCICDLNPDAQCLLDGELSAVEPCTQVLPFKPFHD